MVWNSIYASLNIFYNDAATMEPLANFNLEQESSLSEKKNILVSNDESICLRDTIYKDPSPVN